MIFQGISNHFWSKLKGPVCQHSLQDHYTFLEGRFFLLNISDFIWYNLSFRVDFALIFFFLFLLDLFKVSCPRSFNITFIFLVIGILAAVTFLTFKWSLTILKAISNSLLWLIIEQSLFVLKPRSIEACPWNKQNIRTKMLESDS